MSGVFFDGSPSSAFPVPRALILAIFSTRMLFSWLIWRSLPELCVKSCRGCTLARGTLGAAEKVSFAERPDLETY